MLGGLNTTKMSETNLEQVPVVSSVTNLRNRCMSSSSTQYPPHPSVTRRTCHGLGGEIIEGETSSACPPLAPIDLFKWMSSASSGCHWVFFHLLGPWQPSNNTPPHLTTHTALGPPTRLQSRRRACGATGPARSSAVPGSDWCPGHFRRCGVPLSARSETLNIRKRPTRLSMKLRPRPGAENDGGETRASRSQAKPQVNR